MLMPYRGFGVSVELGVGRSVSVADLQAGLLRNDRSMTPFHLRPRLSAPTHSLLLC